MLIPFIVLIGVITLVLGIPLARIAFPDWRIWRQR